ncbi:putative replication initiation protein [Eel River basin pequenovirus]|nr:putative replication initiation protein [Eel River basin pequenovirus]
MLCLKPIAHLGTRNIPCRQCMNCRINAQRVWACRIQLEGFFHGSSTFVTLTYSDSSRYMETVLGQDGLVRGTVRPRHLKRFIRRLRNELKENHPNADSNFRQFGVGEYGTKSQRPHYHVMLFGIDPVTAAEAVPKAWTKSGEPIGFTSVAFINADRSAYIAQYTTKKMVNDDDPRDRFMLHGRSPEFMRSSRTRPGGIGITAVPWLARTMSTPAALRQLAIHGDVWNSVRIEGRIWPLGDYLRKKIRDHMGIPQKAQDRSILFEHFDRDTGELYTPPLPESYCPDEDVSEILTPFARQHGKKAFYKETLPELEKRAAKLKRKKNSITKTEFV